ncbi:hypothetical protein [Caulobacter sp. B11]|uniref:hypothetical protein n=1 Tax=Caulobacter sp. B11 TaxID=2048899 RepID=UPI0013747792|nr:hypothetical protein [Caulobacter sp. B11]
MSDTPLVSCLTVTQCTWLRFAFLQNAIGDYCRQTHAARELVIVLDPGADEARQAILDHVAGLGRDDIRIVRRSSRASLAACAINRRPPRGATSFASGTTTIIRRESRRS